MHDRARTREEQRALRLAKALRQNLAKRKAQARARQSVAEEAKAADPLAATGNEAKSPDKDCA